MRGRRAGARWFASNESGRYQLCAWEVGQPPRRITNDPCGKNSGWFA
ncbi:hypothetical protein HS125_07170 [bacterium]|nr:hypothetical protein [bacterium]